MTSTSKVIIVLGAALKTPQSVNFKDATAFTFGTISEVVQFVPANAGVPTGGSPTTTKLTTRGKRPNVIIPNPPKVWRKKESPADKKPEATTPSTGGRINPSIFGREDFMTTGGRMLASPRLVQERTTAFTPLMKKEEESVILVGDSAPATRIFSNLEKARKRERQQERKRKALTTKTGTDRSQFPWCMPRKHTKENYEIHTVRVIGESDLPLTHEAALVRDRIVTRSQSSRMTSTPRKDSLSITAEESTSTPRSLPPAREEEPEVAPQTQNILEAAKNNTNQLLVTLLNQMQTLCAQLNDTNQRVTNLQDHIFRQEEPPAPLNLGAQPADIPSGSHHQLSNQKSQLGRPSTPPLEQIPSLAKTQETPPAQRPKRQESLAPQQPFSFVNQLGEKDGYMTREEVQQLIAKQLRQGEVGVTRRMGRPYPAEYDMVPYPLGYTVPKFKSFNGIGNPVQHLAHFIATCGNTGSSDALLLRQFSQSLTGVAFEWYYSLENGSIQTWAEMEDAFTSKFASISDTVDITTLVNTRMKKDESPVDYITRWRNLSIRCEHPLDQAYAVDTVIANIDNWMSPFLRSNKAHTFQELITQVSRLEKSKAPSAPSQFPPPRFKRAESNAVHTGVTEKQKGPQTSSPAWSQDQNRPVLGEENTERSGPSLKQRKNKKYSFKRDKVYKIFKDAVKNGLQLPESKRPEEAGKSDDPMYCPYHRILGHTIEDCYVFKDWIEKQYTSGQITLSKSVLTDSTIG